MALILRTIRLIQQNNMAKARMLHNKISNSLQVNRLSLPARLLFTWMISHADDDGRINGEAEYIKGKVIPMTEYTHAEVESFLQEITNQGLIYRWEVDGNWYIQFPKWLEYQQIRKNRYHPSALPPYQGQVSSNVQPIVGHRSSQYNVIKSNKVKISKGELSNTHRKVKRLNGFIDPLSYEPTNDEQHAVLEAWKRLEPNNPKAFETTYLNAYIHRVPTHLIYQFCSEIEQDNTIDKPGAVFNAKIHDWIYQRDKRLLLGKTE